MTDHEPLPYYKNPLNDQVKLFGDVAGLLLDIYGKPATDINGQPTDTTSWTNTEVETSYELARFRPEATIDPRVKDKIDLKVTESYPSGEKSIRTHVINPITMTKFTRRHQMTTAERANLEERVKDSKALMPNLPKGRCRVLPPRKDGLLPEQEMEFLLGMLRRGFEILEQS